MIGALACVLALCAAGASPAAGPVPQGFVGTVIDGPLFPGVASSTELGDQMDAMVSDGVQNVRVAFDWSYAQPYRNFRQLPPELAAEFVDVGGIPTRFSQMDEIVGPAARRGLTVLPTVIFTPGWDAAPHPSNAFATPAKPAPYANFLSALVHRYGPDGSFWAGNPRAVPVRTWQIWNEPNITTFWPRQPFQPAYVALLRASHDAIKRADPGAKVVLAGMPNYSWQQLGKIYAIRGARRLFDVVAAHPYTKDPQGVITILEKLRAVMDKAGDRTKPIVADEVGWPSSHGRTSQNGGLDFVTTEAGQASRIAQLLPLLGRNRVRLRLMGFDYYTWAGIEGRNARALDFAGLERFRAGEFVGKPALGAFRAAALGLEGCRQKGDAATICLR
jgi:hypothetical protein